MVSLEVDHQRNTCSLHLKPLNCQDSEDGYRLEFLVRVSPSFPINNYGPLIKDRV